MSRSAPLVAFFAVILAACSAAEPDEQTVATEQSQAAAHAVAEADAVEPVVEEGACDDTQAQWTVGKTVTEAEVEQARVDAGAESVRTIKPDQMVTMDFNTNRLNLDMDEAGTVTAARCG